MHGVNDVRSFGKTLKTKLLLSVVNKSGSTLGIYIIETNDVSLFILPKDSFILRMKTTLVDKASVN